MPTVNLPDFFMVTLPKGITIDGATEARIDTSGFTSDMAARGLGFALKEYLNNAAAAKDADAETVKRAIARIPEWARSAPATRSGLPTADRLFIAGVRAMLRAAPFSVKSEAMKEAGYAMPNREAAITVLNAEIAIARAKAKLPADPAAVAANLAKRVTAIDAAVAAQLAALASANSTDLD